MVVFVAGVALRRRARRVIDAWGAGFWELLPFTLQMALIIITGYVVATARRSTASSPRSRASRALRAAPSRWSPFFAMASSWLNWGFSLIFCAMLARRSRAARRGRRLPRARRRVASSASAASGRRASPARPRCRWRRRRRCAGDPRHRRRRRRRCLAGGVIPFRAHRSSSGRALVSVAVEIVVVTVVVWLAAPPAGARATPPRSASSLDDVAATTRRAATRDAATPGEWLEHSPVLTLAVVALGIAYLVALPSRPAA